VIQRILLPALAIFGLFGRSKPSGELGDLPKPHDLHAPAAPGSGEPRLAAAPGGAILTWFEPRATGGQFLRFSRLDGDRWSSPSTIAQGDSFFVNRADLPAVCAFGAQGVAAAWGWRNGKEAHRSRVALSRDGGHTWSAPKILHTDRAGQEHGFVSLLPQGAGVRAIWLDGHNLSDGVAEGTADMTLNSRFIAPTGTLAREQEVDDRACDCCPTSAAMSGTDLLFAYRDRDDQEIRDIAIARLEAGRWSPPALVHHDNWKIEGCPVNGPAIAAQGPRVVVAWYTGAQDTARVLAAFSMDGGHTFGGPSRVDDGHPMGRAGVALMEDGSAVVTWVEGDKDGGQVRIRRVRDGQRPGASTGIAKADDVRGLGLPQLVRDRDRVLAAWTDPGKNTQVRVAEIKLPR
jgi:hypothetical protein